MKKQEYLDLKKRHQKEFEDFPIAYAFNEQQMKEALDKLGATKEECVTVFGHGDIVKRTDAKALIAMMKRHDKELKQKLRDDIEFAEAAFLYEMDNHEYAINWSADEDVLAAFTIEEIEEFLGKIYDGSVTQDDIDAVTRSLGNEVAKVYGW